MYISIIVHKLYHASLAHKIIVFKEQNQQNMNFTRVYKWGEPSRKTLETDTPNPWGLIEPRI